MRNKFIVLCTAIVIVFFSLFIYKRENSAYKNRYHEHLEKKIQFSTYNYNNIDATTYQSQTITEENFSSHLPIISFDTRGQQILGGNNINEKDYIQISMQVYDNAIGDNNFSKATYKTEALIRYRGNSSRFFEKKGIRLKLVNEKNEDNPYSLLGLSEDTDYVLHGPYLDKTLMRNYIGYNITGEVMDYSPNVRFCEVFVNGEYQGVYLLVETIKVSKNRINISKTNKNSNVTSYLLEITPYVNETMDVEYLDNFTKYTNRIREFSAYTIKYPTTSNLTLERNNYINDNLSNFEKIIYSYDYDDNDLGYMNYIDIDSFVNYVVFNEFFLNYDAGNNSTFVYKDKTGKLKLVFWDMNNIWGNNFDDELNYRDFIMRNKSWFQMLLKDEYFTERVISRYYELRKTILSEKYLYKYIDDTIKYLGPAIERNFVRWGDSFTDEKNLYKNIEKNAHSYEDAIEDMKDFIHQRGKWLDKNIESLRQFSHESKVKKYNP